MKSQSKPRTGSRCLQHRIACVLPVGHSILNKIVFERKSIIQSIRGYISHGDVGLKQEFKIFEKITIQK